MTIYEQYAEVDKQIEALEAKKKVIRDEISKELPEEGIKNDFVNAFWTIKKKWTYSPKVDGLTAELKSTKEKEEEDGMAKSEDIKQLTIKVSK